MPGPASPEERLHSSAPDALLSGGRHEPRTDHTGARRREYSMSTRLKTIEFSLNGFHEFNDKSICLYSKRV